MSHAVLTRDAMCVNCETDECAYTLQAHVVDSSSDVDLAFCSTDCLEQWV